MILSFFRPLIAFGFWKRQGADLEINTFALNPDP